MSQLSALYKKNYINWKRGVWGALIECLLPLISALSIYMVMHLSKETSVPEQDYLKMAISLNPEGFSRTSSLTEDYKQYNNWTTNVFELPLFK